MKTTGSGVYYIQCRLNRCPRPDAAVHIRLLPSCFFATRRRDSTNRLQDSLVHRIVRAKECVLNFLFALSVYHGVNGESLGGDTPCRGYLGDGGEFRYRVRPGSGHEHRRLDETTGGSFPLLRHEGFGGRHGIYFLSVCLRIVEIFTRVSNLDDDTSCRKSRFFVGYVSKISTSQRKPPCLRSLRGV